MEGLTGTPGTCEAEGLTDTPASSSSAAEPVPASLSFEDSVRTAAARVGTMDSYWPWHLQQWSYPVFKYCRARVRLSLIQIFNLIQCTNPNLDAKYYGYR